MATPTARTAISGPPIEEFIDLDIDEVVGEFCVSFGGENACDSRADGMVSIARYSRKKGEPDEDTIVAAFGDGGRAHLGMVTTSQLRDIALALTRAADRYDTLQAVIRGDGAAGFRERSARKDDVTPIETRRRRRAQ